MLPLSYFLPKIYLPRWHCSLSFCSEEVMKWHCVVHCSPHPALTLGMKTIFSRLQNMLHHVIMYPRRFYTRHRFASLRRRGYIYTAPGNDGLGLMMNESSGLGTDDWELRPGTNDEWEWQLASGRATTSLGHNSGCSHRHWISGDAHDEDRKPREHAGLEKAIRCAYGD